jgi:hypothetical protein
MNLNQEVQVAGNGRELFGNINVKRQNAKSPGKVGAFSIQRLARHG